MSWRIKSKGLFGFLLFFIWTYAGNAQDHVTVSSDVANIYIDSNTNSPLYITAKEGDTFEVLAFRDGWVRIHLFTGEERYIKRSEVIIVNMVPPYPADPSVRRDM